MFDTVDFHLDVHLAGGCLAVGHSSGGHLHRPGERHYFSKSRVSGFAGVPDVIDLRSSVDQNLSVTGHVDHSFQRSSRVASD